MSLNRYISISLISTLLLAAPIIGAAPVLVEIDLENRAHFDYAKSLAISPWARWGNIFLAEIERADLSSLDKAGIRYRLLSHDSRRDKNYLIAPEACGEMPNLGPFLGEEIFKRKDLGFAQFSSGRANEIEKSGYHLLEIGEKSIPFTYQSEVELLLLPRGANDTIQNLVAQVSPDSLYSYTQRLQDFQTRYSYSDSVSPARQWILNKFASFGIDSVYLDHFFWDSDQWNVVAVIPGTAEPDALIVVGGHYDSVTYGQSPGPLTYAPGADDNGSGTAATLELARILADNPLSQTVMLVAFGQEEQGLYGGKALAAEASVEKWDVRFMLNMDMIGYIRNDTLVKLLHDPISEPVADLMADLALTYAGLTGVKGNASSNSDHWPFMQKGYKSVFAHEYIFNSQGWHKNTDLTDSMDFDYLARVTRLALATVASLGLSACQNYAGDVNGDNAITLTDVIYLVRYIFNTPGFEIDPICRADVNASGSLTLGDVIHLVNFIFGKPGDWTPVPAGGCCAF